jgi:hypothetical protein
MNKFCVHFIVKGTPENYLKVITEEEIRDKCLNITPPLTPANELLSIF